ncbi:mitofilin family membrane protein [Pseudooceanicola aestuarii]|uniref:mitofilin family membrane protein n=1 Tax=Pseudooceanicola aestuarii TaxID=2697319 RepID=UPI0013D1141F|nr:mitofilin family membrane protein [Pseudooceanicola aestuarii]
MARKPKPEGGEQVSDKTKGDAAVSPPDPTPKDETRATGDAAPPAADLPRDDLADKDLSTTDLIDTRPPVEPRATGDDPTGARAAGAQPDVHPGDPGETPGDVPDGQLPETETDIDPDKGAFEAAETTSPPDLTPPAEPEATAQPARRSGFGPAVLGGVVAACIGFGAAVILFPQGVPLLGGGADMQAELERRLTEQQAAIDDLRAAVETGPDLSALDGLSARVADAEQAPAALSARLDELTARLETVEQRPISQGADAETIRAYEAELARLQQAMSDQRAEVEALVTDARQIKADAAETSQQTQQRAALVALRGAIDEGAALTGPVQTLAEAGVEIPQPLVDAADNGVATMASLRAAFPDAARDALNTVRGGEGRPASLGDFLRSQLGARSLSPRDGDDPDAILSRTEAALQSGRLDTAVAEVEVLPDPALSQMQDWLDRARSRLAVVTATEALTSQLDAK